MSFKKKWHIHFDECDPAGIVFFANYFKLAHRSIEEFIMQNGISWQSWFQSPDFGVPLIHAESDYKRPMLQGNSYQAVVKLTKLGESSVQFETTFQTLQQETCAVIKTVHVFVDTKNLNKISIPQVIRQKLEATL